MPSATHAECVHVIRPFLPDVAFAPAPSRVVAPLLHLAVVLASCLAYRWAPYYYWPLLAFVSGQSSACMAFRAHEIAHGGTIRSRPAAYCFEILFWSFALVPATLWQLLHNRLHHTQPNGPNDLDRRYHVGEGTAGMAIVCALLFPNCRLKMTPLCSAAFLAYIYRNLAPLLVSVRATGDGSASRVSSFELARLALEMLVIVALQGVVYRLSGSWVAYLWAGPVSILVCSAIITAYILTNHFLNPLGTGRHPLEATTSVAVPALCDCLHSHFSFHTEHHLFPRLNPVYYPLVKTLLERHFASQYCRMPMSSAFAKLIRMGVFVEPPQMESTKRGRNVSRNRPKR